MKHARRLLLAIAVFSVALCAQDLAGAWQGTLQAGAPLRIVLKLAKTDGGYSATMYSIDQGARPVPAGAVSVQGSTVTIPIPAIAGKFEGRLSADGNTISGNWSQGEGTLPLVLTRANPANAWAIPAGPAALKPMAPDASPSFEVATIKPSAPGERGVGIGVNGRHLTTANTSVNALIMFAYDVDAKQIIGGPAWMATDDFDLAGEPDAAGEPSLRQWKLMLQKLLADRFQLTFHRGQKELSAYVLVVAKSGPKLTAAAGDPNGLPTLGFGKLGSLRAANATMADFAGVMQSAVFDRPVVDQTGLRGKYDFTLQWTPDETQFAALGAKVPPPSDDTAAPPDIFTAIQQQLGLRLESQRTMVPVLMIDRIAKPTAN